MTDSPFTLELRVWERFGTRKALIDFLLDIEDVDQKKLMNIFICFRKVYNNLLPESPSRQQNAVSIEAGSVWKEEKERNPAFWNNLVRDVHAEHKARFPWYPQKMAYIKSLPAKERKAANSKKGAKKKRGDVDTPEQISRHRPAPYTVPGSSPSSSRSRSSPSHSPSEPRSPSTLQASSSAVSPFATPHAVPIYPSVQPPHMMTQDGHGGWQAPGMAAPMFPPGNTPLNGGQYMAPIPPAPVAVSAPLDMQMQYHSVWTNATPIPAPSYHQPTTATAHSAWTGVAAVPATPYYHQPIPATAPPSLVPCHEIGFGYRTYPVGMAGNALLPTQAVPQFPSYQPEWAYYPPDVQVTESAFPPAGAPQPTRVRFRAKL